MGLQVSLCGELFGLNGLLPLVRRGHDVTIHHIHIHVSSGHFLSLVATQGDHTGRRKEDGDGSSVLFFYLFAVCVPASSQLSSQKQSHSHAAFSFQQFYTNWTLCALTNPLPVLSQLWNNRRSASTTGNHSLQKNNPHPTGLLDPLEQTTLAKQPVTSTH